MSEWGSIMIKADEPPYASGRRAVYVVFVLLAAFIVAYLDRQVISLLLPSLKADMGVSDTQASLIQGFAFASIYAFAILPMGWVADHTSRRNLLVAGITFWSLATLACGFASTFWQLFAARMAVGLGEACLAPACISIMADYIRPSQRGRAVGVMMTGTSIGGGSSLFLGGLLLTSLTHGGAAALVPEGWAPWQMVFVAFAAPGLLVAALVYTLKEPPRRDAPQAGSRPDSQIRLVDFTRDHIGPVALFFSLVTCMSVLTYAVTPWAPTVLMRIYGMTPTETGAAYGAILLIGGVTAGVCSGLVSDRLVRRWPLGGRVLIPLIGLPVELCAQLTFMFSHDTAVIIGALAVSSFTMTFVAASFYPALQDLFPNQLRGRATALLGLLSNVFGLGCGPTLVALVTDQVFRNEMMLQKSVGIVAVSMSVLGCLLALGLPHLYAQARKKRLASQPAGASARAAAVATA
jgi:MFS family permease